jgi:hypothetical protein
VLSGRGEEPDPARRSNSACKILQSFLGQRTTRREGFALGMRRPEEPAVDVIQRMTQFNPPLLAFRGVPLFSIHVHRQDRLPSQCTLGEYQIVVGQHDELAATGLHRLTDRYATTGVVAIIESPHAESGKPLQLR